MPLRSTTKGPLTKVLEPNSLIYDFLVYTLSSVFQLSLSRFVLIFTTTTRIIVGLSFIFIIFLWLLLQNSRNYFGFSNKLTKNSFKFLVLITHSNKVTFIVFSANISFSQFIVIIDHLLLRLILQTQILRKRACLSLNRDSTTQVKSSWEFRNRKSTK